VVQGDFNCDGSVNTADFDLLAPKFNQHVAAAPALGTLVPEPAGLGLATLGMALVMRRKRRG
jgi:hypothetical protein